MPGLLKSGQGGGVEQHKMDGFDSGIGRFFKITANGINDYIGGPFFRKTEDPGGNGRE